MNKKIIVFVKHLLLMLTIAVLIRPISVVAMEDEQLAVVDSNTSNQWSPVSNSKLASLRGGFVLANGIVVDISFDKRIFQNGVETYNSYFESSDNMSFVKNGDNITSQLNNGLINTVIQNNLDNQTLQTINTINIDIQNLNNVNQSFNRDNFIGQFVLPNSLQLNN